MSRSRWASTLHRNGPLELATDFAAIGATSVTAHVFLDDVPVLTVPGLPAVGCVAEASDTPDCIIWDLMGNEVKPVKRHAWGQPVDLSVGGLPSVLADSVEFVAEGGLPVQGYVNEQITLANVPLFPIRDVITHEFPACPADVNGDTIVDVLDLVALILNWGPCAGCPEDVTGDDVIDVLDLVAMILAWGPC